MTQNYQLDLSLSYHVLPLAVHLFCAELVEGVILRNFYSLGLLLEANFMLKSCGWLGWLVVWVAYKIIETALSPNSSFPLGLDLGLGLGLVNTALNI